MKIPNVLAMTVSSILPVLAVEPPFLDPATLTAWCVVPFDSKKRVPEERARMLQGLGFKKFAYDWREENVATFDQEVVALKTQGVELVAWWFPTHAENAHARVILDVIKRHHIHPQLWVMGGGEPTKNANEQEERIQAEATRIQKIVKLAAPYHCDVHLYNHNGWFGQTDNQIAVIKKLGNVAITHVGMIYNFSHGHQDVEHFAAIWQRMQPYVVAVNITGMEQGGEERIIPPAQGTDELAMLSVIQASGWRGPIGLIAEQGGDAEITLGNGLRGVSWLRQELAMPGSGGDRPTPR